MIYLFIFIHTSCDDGLNDLADLGDVNNIKTSGFIVVGTTSSNTARVKYFENLPSGTIDLSDGIDFPRFFPNSIYNHAIFLARPDESPGYSKYVVSENGDLFEIGTLPTLNAGSFRIDVRDAEFGVFQDRATPDNITIFNPTTLQIIDGVDMNEGFVPGDIDQRYQRFIFRGDDVFAPIRGNVTGESFSSFILHQANLITGQFVGDTQRNGNGVSDIITFNNFGQRLIDDSGNLYVADAGNYTGGQVWGRVNKIPAGSNEIDPDYVFEPARALNPSNVFLPTFNNFYVLNNGKAIAKVNSETPQAAIDIILSVGGNLANLTPAQTQEILSILFSAESARWCFLDLNAFTVTPIANIPAVGVFSGGQVFFDGNTIFFPVANATENAYFSYNTNTEVVEKAFEITGADISGVYNIANNN
ncbi:hypothetical protein J8281_09290 [Aquimarina sp. U1-2]|uniref:hypothetical protein n=1 Tax=Aquimarina sp. U1-2 TaxID=2823141 RepID=UPI001AEC7705|nr:hypothetical protein [Aquimarina sp. U1-2]MBP2832378.1 hypothetical protein [Aquimarina sp. U1-2]